MHRRHFAAARARAPAGGAAGARHSETLSAQQKLAAPLAARSAPQPVLAHILSDRAGSWIFDEGNVLEDALGYIATTQNGSLFFFNKIRSF
ncbi:hypothetical protein EVAR_90535_1 [Eumeta japonica]|uniref:Uncharacterized protein n=1 Tax=Eumeta variegata TaxID=151549 RepID=A0A4C1XZT2_EUMVA|nr:hypothetical protein EVAR_90535_1 [Eumeta japonica]